MGKYNELKLIIPSIYEIKLIFLCGIPEKATLFFIPFLLFAIYSIYLFWTRVAETHTKKEEEKKWGKEDKLDKEKKDYPNLT